MLKLDGKVALVTGCGTRGEGWGNGKAIAVLLARQGATVFGVDRDIEAAKVTEKIIADEGGKAHVTTANVTIAQDVQDMVKACMDLYGRIDILINNAGALVQRVPIEEITDELFDNVVYLNVRSAMMCTAAAVAAMRQQGQGGVVINVTSVAARHGGGAGASLYAGSKGFVSTMTRGLAKELVKDNIRVNAVAPGVITTPFHERFSTPQMLEGFRATIPMNRLGTAEECAGAFVYLASEQMSGYVTGQIIEVNGGQYMP